VVIPRKFYKEAIDFGCDLWVSHFGFEVAAAMPIFEETDLMI